MVSVQSLGAGCAICERPCSRLPTRNPAADTISALIREYELPAPVVEAVRDRSRNLNRLMHFCGVRYQLVD